MLPFTAPASGVMRMACMSERERHALARVFRADGVNARGDLSLPFPKQTLGLGCARAGGGEEFGLKTLAVASGVFLPHVVGEPPASGEVSLCVLTYRDHPQHTLVYELVYAARFQMVNVCRKMRLISTFRVVLVGVAGFEPATPSSRTPGHTTNVRICQRFCVRLLPSNHDPFRESGREAVAGHFRSFPAPGRASRASRAPFK